MLVEDCARILPQLVLGAAHEQSVVTSLRDHIGESARDHDVRVARSDGWFVYAAAVCVYEESVQVDALVDYRLSPVEVLELECEDPHVCDGQIVAMADEYDISLVLSLDRLLQCRDVYLIALKDAPHHLVYVLRLRLVLHDVALIVFSDCMVGAACVNAGPPIILDYGFLVQSEWDFVKLVISTCLIWPIRRDDDEVLHFSEVDKDVLLRLVDLHVEQSEHIGQVYHVVTVLLARNNRQSLDVVVSNVKVRLDKACPEVFLVVADGAATFFRHATHNTAPSLPAGGLDQVAQSPDPQLALEDQKHECFVDRVLVQNVFDKLDAY